MDPATQHTVQPVCIRPGYVWPALGAIPRLQQCGDEAWSLDTAGRHVTALFCGCGPDGADVAVLASQLLAGAFSPAHWLEQHQHDGGQLAPSELQFAFAECHQQLLQLQQQQMAASSAQQQYEQQHRQPAGAPAGSSSRSGSPAASPAACPDLDWSGTSALLVALEQAHSRLLVASAGLCKAVLARGSPGGDLTVLELAPRLALGHDPQETARLDAAGSSILYSSSSSSSVSAPQVASAIAAGGGPQQEAVLVGPDGRQLPGVCASRLLGFRAASSAGVVPDPLVTSWRLTGAESFAVLGSPGLWAAMSPAEVVDYVAAALASNVCSAAPGAGTPPAGDSGGSAAPLLSVGDLLTLEAQERLKLRLMDSLCGQVPGPAAAAAAGTAGATAPAAAAAAAAPVGCGVVPDVSAVVLLLDGSRALQPVALDLAAAATELQQTSRACRSNSEARALQALWAASSFCCDQAVAGPPGPALSCLLPALTVAVHWPSSCWPGSPPVTVPAAMAAPRRSSTRAGSGRASIGSYEAAGSAASDGSKMSLEEAAAAAGLLSGSSGTQAQGVRAPGFSLSPRLSCELDLSHDHASHGSCGCLAGVLPDCCGGGAPSAGSSPSEQSMIVHKVRPSGPCELESLLFGSATTSFPDTTVARILKPRGFGSARVVGLHTAASASDVLAPPSAAFRAGLVWRASSGGGLAESSLYRAAKGCAVGRLPSRRQSRSGNISSFSGSGADSPRHDSAAVRDTAAYAAAGSLAGHQPYVQQGLLSSCHSAPPLEQQLAQLEERQLQQQRESLRLAASMPATAGSGYVKQARSYQALSALQAAAGSGAAGILAGSSVPVNQGSSSCGEFMGGSSSNNSSGSFSMARSLSAAGQAASQAAGQQGAFRSAFAAANTQQRGPGPCTAMEAAASSANEQRGLAFEGYAGAAADACDSEAKVRGGVSRGRSSNLLLQALADAPSSAADQATPQAAAAAASSDAQHSGSLSAFVVALEAQQAAEGEMRSSNEFSKASSGSQGSSFLSSSNLSSSGGSHGRNDDGGRASGEWKSVLKGAAVKATRKASSAAATLAQSSSRAIRRLSDTGGADSSSSLALGGEPGVEEPERQGWGAAAAGPHERCVRAGRAKGAGLRGCRSTPDLQRLATEVAGSDRRIRGGMALGSSGGGGSRRLSSDGAKPRAAAPAAAGSLSSSASVRLIRFDDASHQQPLHASQSTSALLRSRRRHSYSSSDGDSFSSRAGSTSSAALGGDVSFTTIVAGSAGMLQPRPLPLQLPGPGEGGESAADAPSPAAAASAGRGICRAASGAWSEGSCGADGAVHGGELGEESLEGQMHGGKRSSSLTMSSSLLQSLSLPSSAADDSDLQAACTSPVPPSYPGRQLVGSCSFGGSSSAPMYAVPAASSASRASFSSGVGPTFPFARQNRSLGAASGNGAESAAAAAAMAAAAGSSFGLGSAAEAPAGDSSSSGIEVLQMASGSFTRVKLAASAPAAPAGSEYNTLGSSLALLQQQQHFSASCIQSGSAPSLEEAARGFSRVTAVAHHSKAVRRSFSSGAGGWGPDAATRPPVGASPGTASGTGRWAASKAWGAAPGGSGASGFRSAFAAFESAGCRNSNKAAAAAAVRAAAAADAGWGSESQVMSALAAVPPAPTAPRVSFSDGLGAGSSSSQLHAAAAEAGSSLELAAAAAGMLGVKRQRSTPLPTLAESPPGSLQEAASMATCARFIGQQRGGSRQPPEQPQPPEQLQQSAGQSISSSEVLEPYSQASSLSHYHLAAAAAAAAGSSSGEPDSHSGASLESPGPDHDTLSLSDLLESGEASSGSRGTRSFEFSRPSTFVDPLQYESPAPVGGAVHS